MTRPFATAGSEGQRDQYSGAASGSSLASRMSSGAAAISHSRPARGGKCKPTVLIDAATLTGGVVVALGSWSAGVFCNDEKLLKRLDAAAETTGERIWRLPLWTEHRDFMRAKHADLWNSGPKRDGHPIQGAAFLSFFVDEKIPWAHLDIAGVSAVDGDTPLHVVGPTGYGVRLLTEVVRGYAAK